MIRRHHYEQAFEGYLRTRRIPYVAVHEARKALLPEGVLESPRLPSDAGEAGGSLKNFDFVIYGQGANLLVEVKGRRLARSGRLESWATLDDVESLRRWGELFGASFEPVLVFVYWCEHLPPDALFEEIFEHAGRWYAIRVASVREYAAAMKVRSPRWRTVDVPPAAFDALTGPLAPPSPHGVGSERRVGFSLLEEAGREIPPLPALDVLLPREGARTMGP